LTVLVDALSATLRALSFVALFQAGGTAVFLALLDQELGTEPALRRLGARSAVLAIVLLIAQYVLEAARMSGDLAGAIDPTMQGLALHSGTIVAFSWRLLGLVLILIGVRHRGLSGVVVSALGVVVLSAAFTFVGHTANAPQRWLLSLMLLMHLLLVAFWFGALGPLYLISARESPPVAARIVQQFSARAVWLAPGVLIAGLVMAVVLLPGLAALRTAYGQLLIVKALGFSALMVLAALNKWRWGPILARGSAEASRAFRRSVAGEYGLITAILCITAVLTMFYSPD
jgi:putative copper export protein